MSIMLLALIALMTVVMRVAFVPASNPLAPLRFEWGFGLYASGVLALCILLAATRFGGKLDDIPTKQRREGGETLH